jgi:hypothetical protein
LAIAVINGTIKREKSDNLSLQIAVLSPRDPSPLHLSQSDPPMSESFWQKDRMATNIHFDLCILKHFSPVANFGDQSLVVLGIQKSKVQRAYQKIDWSFTKVIFGQTIEVSGHSGSVYSFFLTKCRIKVCRKCSKTWIAMCSEGVIYPWGKIRPPLISCRWRGLNLGLQ